MEKLKIFVTHRIDKESFASNNELIYNIRCGATFDQNESNIPGDDTGINISNKRLTYCELTTQYWAWKNYDCEYYGFSHYRRYLSLIDRKFDTDIYDNVIENYIDEKILQKYGYMCNEDMDNYLGEYDLLIPEPHNTKNTGEGTVYEQFCKAEFLHKNDIDNFIKLIKNKFGEYYDSLMSYFNGYEFYPCNMFIMKKDLFFEYSEWMFSILNEFEREIDLTNYSEEEIRCIGHLGERLLGVYYTYLAKKSNFRIKKIQRIYIEDASVEQCLKPLENKNTITVLLASNDYYVPYIATTIKSIIVNSNRDYFYDFVVVHDQITDKSTHLLKSSFSNVENSAIRFFNVKRKIKNYKLIPNNHISVETFYRLIVHDIFKEFEKIIYLDVDLIVKGDISELYNFNLDGYLIAAAKDPDFISQYNGMNKKIKLYCKNVLKLYNPYEYAQAGVIIFNIQEMKKRFLPEELIMQAEKNDYIYLDQDILNVMCQKHIKFLQPEWNVLTDCAGARINNIKRYAPFNIYRDYMESRKNPKIIHFAGFSKPWNNPNEDYADEFWSIAKQSSFYEVIIERMCTHVSSNITNNFNANKINRFSLIRLKIKTRIKDSLYKLYIKTFPESSNRREWVRTKYYVIRGK